MKVFNRKEVSNVQKITSAFERLFLIDYFLEKKLRVARYTTFFSTRIQSKIARQITNLFFLRYLTEDF